MLSDEEISEIEKCTLGAPYSNIPAHPTSALIATIRELRPDYDLLQKLRKMTMKDLIYLIADTYCEKEKINVKSKR